MKKYYLHECIRHGDSMKKDNKGITLIALIITIIILLILAIVSIKIVTSEKLIKNANAAVSNYTVAKEEETLNIAYSDYKIGVIKEKTYKFQEALDNNNAEATVEEETDNYWKIKFKETNNTYILYKKDGKIEKTANKNVPKNLKVGDYVDYPSLSKKGRQSWVERTESGISYGSKTSKQGYDLDITTKSGGWRVMKIDESTGKITLVSATASTPNNSSDGELVLKSEQVYNNGVLLLNRICDELYSIDGYGKARSMNLEDLNQLLGTVSSPIATTTLNVRFSAENAERDNSYYPARLQEEQGIAIDSDDVSKTGLTKSEGGKEVYKNSEAIYDKTNTNTIGTDQNVTYKNYNKTLKLAYTETWRDETNARINKLTDTTIKELVLGKDETRTWWLATRSLGMGTWWNNKVAYYGMFEVVNGKSLSQESNFASLSQVDANWVSTCDKNYESGVGQIAGWFRPVIELDDNVSIDTSESDTDGDGTVQDGSFEQPWAIVK